MTMLEFSETGALHYSAEGQGNALLFFNGNTLPLQFWDPIAAALAEQYRAIRFDARNAGGSRFEGSFMVEIREGLTWY
jgi:pimeloyl-ACP methyl ester carboxylesterase